MSIHHTLSQAFLSAAVEPHRWLDALRLLADATRSDRAQLIGIGRHAAVEFSWVNDMSERMMRAFDGPVGSSPLYSFRVAAAVAAPATSLLYETHYEAARPGLVDEEYVELCHDWQIPYGCQTNLFQDDDGLIGFALLRSEHNGVTSADQRALFDRARHNAAAAVSLQRALAGEGHRLIAGTFEAMGSACFVLDGRMRVGAMSPLAEALLRDGRLAMVDGRIALPDAADDRRLAKAMVALTESDTPAGHLLVRGPEGALALRLHRLPPREWDMGFAPFAVLTVRGGNAGGGAQVALLRDVFGMTQAEAEVAALLADGVSRDDICRRRGISRETLRTHLRGGFAKMGVGREVDAVHLLHGLIG